ncbi:hypothetical protein DEU56DRAFT_908528 [Suillus clintonianus]|uniref:uncharacterized protein n=1 Tax=Suillus clintonianus TaxID=1904413 RepID=UPI001B878546|nr:uncharacterized protein DEU56DRAFT_908528 [Suillus clintonianus]KAG2150890.1 hypothetical protein DEU56DRAFT_908528 [Suillus clintonianus]
MSDNLHHRDLWEWAADLLRDPRLFPHMVFDAQRLSKFDGKTFVRFIDEPFTADTFWNVQSQLPPGGKPLAFVLYADKTRLSSFGTARGYPVVARLVNLPADIHNGQGVGSGNIDIFVVGTDALTQVKEDRDHAGKPNWVNFKNAVWHESLSKILSSLASKSHTGQWFECLDNIQRWFFPIILILSADYEEQCVMSLIRGIKCLWPCPVCLVPHDQLLNTLKCYPCWTSAQLQEVLKAARDEATAEEKEEKLKEYGLRDIANAFSTMMCTDVHNALLWDQLHFNGGLYRDHLWAELQKFIVSLGRAKVAQIDKNYEAFPRWRNLRHLAQVMNISFADGGVYKDISKMVVHAAHAILTEDDCPRGYLLLRCTRLFLEVDAYAALEVHTTSGKCVFAITGSAPAPAPPLFRSPLSLQLSAPAPVFTLPSALAPALTPTPAPVVAFVVKQKYSWCYTNVTTCSSFYSLGKGKKMCDMKVKEPGNRLVPSPLAK